MKHIIFLFSVCASPAFACPVIGDLSGAGIQTTNVEGTTNQFRMGNGAIDVVVTYPDGFGARETRYNGVYLTAFEQVDDGAILEGEGFTVRYEGGVFALPVPAPNLSVQTASDLVFDGGQTAWTSNITMGDLTTKQVGGCTYDVFDVRMELQGPLEPLQIESYVYFPSLGIAHLESSGVGSMIFDTSLVSIEVME